MKLGNFIRDQKATLKDNRRKVAKVNDDKASANHVVAIKNKIYDNHALEASTARSSQAPLRAPSANLNNDISSLKASV